MTSIKIDRLDGLSSAAAIKGPCLVATTGNITLYGEQTIDGVAVVTGNRVLVKDQTAAYENGIYVCDTGQWRRTKDFNRTDDVVEGTQLLVTDGATYTRSLWCVVSSNPIVVGTDSISFSQTIVSAAEIEAATAAAIAAAEAAAAYADFARNNWAIAARLTGTGVQTDYTLLVDPGSENNMFVTVGGVDQVPGGDSPPFQLVYIAGTPCIRITIPSGITGAVRVSNAINVLTPSDGSVTNPKLASGAVTYDKMQDISATLRLLGRKTAGAGDPEEISAAELRDLFLPAGAVVDSITGSYTANTTLTTQIPADNTIPQIGEGTQLISVSITPKTITNKIRIRYDGWGSVAAATNIISAIFNGNANAIHAAMVVGAAASARIPVCGSVEYTPGVLTAQTISLRVGPSSAVNISMNGDVATPLFGGVSGVRLIVEEIKA
ncbi:hypothetical protein [Rhizobium sp. BK251]|uniref:hypothetical protein n=1 Tax=Rhizobium sp. BK251 TaxID=2512125 RepID=UPI0010521CDF|nr:hypothetical protein [Rhizobium sp. BK251]TCL70657.1 hypothetical protein EV286_107535 [Rhizobium sp. BK251]